MMLRGMGIKQHKRHMPLLHIKIARIYSVEEGVNITFLDLMRRGIQEKYQLGVKYNE